MFSNRYFNHSDVFPKNVSIFFSALAIILEAFLFQTVVKRISDKNQEGGLGKLVC
jgi:hypothetical protein